MPSRLIEDLHPDLQPLCREFLKRCQAAGLDILITCTYRSRAEQDQLYAQGRDGNTGARVTNARGGQSAHNFTLQGRPAARAFDIVPMVGGKPMWRATHPAWQQAGAIGMTLGLNWYGRPGAPFREYPHFELARG
ncbi:peptidoglycan L-alanyl-D-glutamate endopeptidase CwlK [Chitinivorax tropicus]|uniref:Peptidoglycan L-alanyl-D-glutamate endopeptidase CwlK n=1 Tax=Chitinivorax tropicus TaxID=714531 RepID=A0A840MFG4_9PROT|nr:M15 family metallopeptidase [Chitinivorax tropicus]MBB5017408.1 peptidoglycan L-alanyl-D-glutamate endopeptidase CwlK [Chitinivorax tropicus]